MASACLCEFIENLMQAISSQQLGYAHQSINIIPTLHVFFLNFDALALFEWGMVFISDESPPSRNDNVFLLEGNVGT